MMETYQTIKKFLAEGGKCLLIENGRPIGVVLTMEEYELPRGKSQNQDSKEKASISEIDTVKPAVNPIGAAMVEEMNFPSASADIDEINLADTGDVTLEDLGLDELQY